jgi:hypothetical protein
LTILEPNGGEDGLGAIVRINPSNGGSQLVSDNAIAGAQVFNHPTALTLEPINGIGYLTMIDPTGGAGGLGEIVRIDPSSGGSQLVSDSVKAGNNLFNHPTELITEVNGSGTQYLTFLDPTGGSDGLGSIVRINEFDGGSQLVSDNAIAGGQVFDHPTALTLEPINGTGYLTMIDPTGAGGLGSIVRINPDNGSSQVVSDSVKAGNNLFNHPTELITEVNGSGTQYLTFLDPTGGSDGLGSIVRINEFDGGSQLVSDNAIAGNQVYNHPIALTLEPINGTGYLTMFDPTGGSNGLGTVVRINPENGGSQLVWAVEPGQVEFSAGSFSAGENSGTATITLARIIGSVGAVSVLVSTSNGTATAGIDYTTVSQSVVWADGDSSPKIVTVPILDARVVGGQRTVNLTLSSAGGGATLGSPASAVLTITDNDSAGALQFSAGSFSADETSGLAVITVARSGGSVGAVSALVYTSNGTATAGTDYTAVSQTVSWADGDSSPKTVTVPILDDGGANPEGNQTINLALSNPTDGATLGAPSTAVLTILDNEGNHPGQLQFSSPSYSVGENGGFAQIAVTRTGGSDGTVTVDCATTTGGSAVAGADYTPSSGTLTFAPDQTSQTLTVPILDDSGANPEGNQTINLALSNPTDGATLGTPSTAVLTIPDNEAHMTDPGQLQFGAPSYSALENGGFAQITVTRAGGSDGTVTALFATSGGSAVPGTNYMPVAQVLSWADGESGAKTILIPVRDDNIYGGDATVNLTLTNPTGGATLGSPATTVLTIQETDRLPIIRVVKKGKRFRVEALDPATGALRRLLGTFPSRIVVRYQDVDADGVLDILLREKRGKRVLIYAFNGRDLSPLHI